MDISNIKFNNHGLVPAIAQDYASKQVLMMAYMNQEALEKTIENGQAYYFSRSRNCLWHKGETSGHFQNVKEIRYDCDGDTLLLLVEQIGAACHTNRRSCFYRDIEGNEIDTENNADSPADIFTQIYDVIIKRRENPEKGSYTNYLFDKGIDKILKKVGEETAEVIIAAKNNDPHELTCEVSDLIFHLSVMLANNGLSWEDIVDELQNRRKKEHNSKYTTNN